ncbi:hypothetical protein [Streptomyces sp. NBC_01304]|uniref:hypothetical protein n=1 Tax=Streptomyces sp. NBC_01304 TaxID=2903818 RepID=UPI002E0ECB64|nr:hypothetical protein OG430_16675 [Streptomyces sp. NBC_01304]
MQVSRTLVALAVSVSLSAGTVALAAAPAMAANDPDRVAAARAGEDERAVRVERSIDKLYSAIEKFASRTSSGKADAGDQRAVYAALDEVFSTTKDAEPEPPVTDPAAMPPADTAAEPAKDAAAAAKKADDDKKKEAIAKAKAALKTEVDVLVKAATGGDVLKLVASLQLVPKLAIDLVLQVGLGNLGIDLSAILGGLKPPAGLPALPNLLPIPGLMPPAATPAIPGLTPPANPLAGLIPGLK